MRVKNVQHLTFICNQTRRERLAGVPGFSSLCMHPRNQTVHLTHRLDLAGRFVLQMMHLQ
jgi:hypothetical protein